MKSKPEVNAQTLELELEWLSAVLNARLKIYFKQETDIKSIYEIMPPNLSKSDSDYAHLVNLHGFTFEERIVLILALVPHISPGLLDILWFKDETTGKRFSEFGGVKRANCPGFLPTGETAAFILAENGLSSRFKVMEYFKPLHAFHKNHILYLDDSRPNEPFLSGALCIHNNWIDLFTSGHAPKPDYSPLFPGSLITSPLDWNDLVLEDYLLSEIHDIRTWIENENHILNDWGLKDKIKPGFKALFYGPDGTGKTTTACLLGKSAGLDVYRIDLSQMALNWELESEKLLARFFDMAQSKKWILFFEEADALFGKRGHSTSANNRYSNQAVAYFLQQIETYNGLVILATNLVSSIDDAFLRRFQSRIHFAMPNAENRLQIWQNVFSGNLTIDERVDFRAIAKKYELSGGSIINVLKYCAIKMLQHSHKKVLLTDIENGIREEIKKIGKLA